jgi:hypothetical protein
MVMTRYHRVVVDRCLKDRGNRAQMAAPLRARDTTQGPGRVFLSFPEFHHVAPVNPGRPS